MRGILSVAVLLVGMLAPPLARAQEKGSKAKATAKGSPSSSRPAGSLKEARRPGRIRALRGNPLGRRPRTAGEGPARMPTPLEAAPPRAAAHPARPAPARARATPNRARLRYEPLPAEPLDANKLMAEFYVLEGMRAGEVVNLREFDPKHNAWRKRAGHLRREFVEREAPRLYQAMLHVMATELSFAAWAPRDSQERFLRQAPGWLRHVILHYPRTNRWPRATSDQILEAAAAEGISIGEFARAARDIFDQPGWDFDDEFDRGGKPWAKIADTLGAYPGPSDPASGQDSQLESQVRWMDDVFHLQHNAGHLFSGSKEGVTFDGDMGKALLDAKFRLSNPVELLGHIDGRRHFRPPPQIDSRIRQAAETGKNIGLW